MVVAYEDARVELKADWIDESKMARRLAGHANAANGEHVLWLFGVDEKAEKGRRVPGVQPAELEKRWPVTNVAL